MTETNPKSLITFDALAGAYTSRLLSEEATRILLSLVTDIPPSWKSKTEAFLNQRED